MRSTVLAISALLLLAISGAAQERWQIVRAQYGEGDRWADVTSRVQSLVRGDSLDFRVDNDTMGVDPARDHKKSLRLEVRDDRGRVRQLNFSEKDQVRLLVGYAGGRYGRGLQITSARYGAGSRMMDVTARLASWVRGDRLSVRVNNDDMGGDPADDHKKYLEVAYTYNGQSGQTTVKEGDMLELPGTGTGMGAYGALSILRAEYGAGSSVWDVTSFKATLSICGSPMIPWAVIQRMTYPSGWTSGISTTIAPLTSWSMRRTLSGCRVPVKRTITRTACKLRARSTGRTIALRM
jgi:hypothetical protein